MISKLVTRLMVSCNPPYHTREACRQRNVWCILKSNGYHVTSLSTTGRNAWWIQSRASLRRWWHKNREVRCFPWLGDTSDNDQQIDTPFELGRCHLLKYRIVRMFIILAHFAAFLSPPPQAGSAMSNGESVSNLARNHRVSPHWEKCETNC